MQIKQNICVIVGYASQYQTTHFSPIDSYIGTPPRITHAPSSLKVMICVPLSSIIFIFEAIRSSDCSLAYCFAVSAASRIICCCSSVQSLSQNSSLTMSDIRCNPDDLSPLHILLLVELFDTITSYGFSCASMVPAVSRYTQESHRCRACSERLPVCAI